MDSQELEQRLAEATARMSFVKRTRSQIMTVLLANDANHDLDQAKIELVNAIAEEDVLTSDITQLTAQLTSHAQESCGATACTPKPSAPPLESHSERFFDSFANQPARQSTGRLSPARAVSRSRTVGFKAVAKPRSYKSGDDITLFFERFRNFVVLSNVEDNLSLLLLNYVEDDSMYRTLRSARISTAQSRDIDQLIAAYENHLFPSTETRILRSTMPSTKQKLGESARDFSMRIEELGSRACPNLDLREEACFQTLTAGLRSVQIRQRLMESEEDTFTGATRLAVKLERIAETLSAGDQNTVEIDEFEVARVDNRNSGRPSSSNSRPSSFPGAPSTYRPVSTNSGTHPNVTCFKCTGKGHKAFECPGGTNVPLNPQNDLSHITCFSCQEKGHYATSCPTRSSRPGNNPVDNRGSWRSQQTTPPNSSTASLNPIATGFTVHPSRQ